MLEKALYTSVTVYLRLAVGIGFLSAVADRFGLWSEAAARGRIAWGSWEKFVEYTAVLSPWSPEFLVPVLAFTATILEAVFGVLLIVGWHTRVVAWLSGGMMLVFALSMFFATGPKSALDASVFAAAGAAFALALLDRSSFSIDGFLKRKGNTETPSPEIESSGEF